MLIIVCDIFIYVRPRKRVVIQPGHNNPQQRIVQKQMFILMFASICIFLISNLPQGI